MQGPGDVPHAPNSISWCSAEDNAGVSHLEKQQAFPLGGSSVYVCLPVSLFLPKEDTAPSFQAFPPHPIRLPQETISLGEWQAWGWSEKVP